MLINLNKYIYIDIDGKKIGNCTKTELQLVSTKNIEAFLFV